MILTLDTNQAAKETNEPLVYGGVAMWGLKWGLDFASGFLAFPNREKSKEGTLDLVAWKDVSRRPAGC